MQLPIQGIAWTLFSRGKKQPVREADHSVSSLRICGATSPLPIHLRTAHKDNFTLTYWLNIWHWVGHEYWRRQLLLKLRVLSGSMFRYSFCLLRPDRGNAVRQTTRHIANFLSSQWGIFLKFSGIIFCSFLPWIISQKLSEILKKYPFKYMEILSLPQPIKNFVKWQVLFDKEN